MILYYARVMAVHRGLCNSMLFQNPAVYVPDVLVSSEHILQSLCRSRVLLWYFGVGVLLL